MTGNNGTRPAPILDLDDLIEPGAQWTHREINYAYVRWSSLGLLERRRIDNKHRRIQALEDVEEPTDEEAAEYEAAVRDLLVMITPEIETTVVDGMEPEQRANVVTYFLALRLVRTDELREKRSAKVADWIEATMPTTPLATPTASSSPDSIDSGPKPTRSSGSPFPTPSSRRTSAPSSSSRRKSASRQA